MTASANHRILYEQNDFPAFQNRMYPSRDDARDCPRGDLRIVEDLDTGLVYNAAFRPEIDQEDRVAFPTDFSDELAPAGTLTPVPSIIRSGASKGVIPALMYERAGRPVETIIDITPAKQGLYLAATGLQACSPADVLPALEAGTPMYAANSNHLEEVLAIRKTG